MTDTGRTRAQQLLGDTAPDLVRLTDDVLFGDVWANPGLSPRDRSLVTVAALVSLYRTDQLGDQDDPDHVAGVTQWTERHNFEDYLAWRTERGFSATFEAMLTRPFVIHYYDIAYFGEGIAARQSTQR
jgi:Carboxymuconolactone decarboxylase family